MQVFPNPMAWLGVILQESDGHVGRDDGSVVLAV